MFFLDLSICILLLLGIFLGLREELTLTLLNLAKSFFSFELALHHYPHWSHKISEGEVISEAAANIGSFFLLWLGFFLAGSLAIFIFRKIVEIKFIPLLERPVGLLAGLINGIFWSITLLLFSLSFSRRPASSKP